MDQIKIGEFLKELRKEKRLTQEHPRIVRIVVAIVAGMAVTVILKLTLTGVFG